MGLWDKLKNEFIDIIDWEDNTNDTLVYKFPRYQNEIKNGAQLTVRPSQVAILVDEGKLADIFTEGRHELSTANMPILTTIKGWKYGFNSPFKVDIFFVSMRQFVDLKWGTKNPIMLRDPEFGPLRIRAFGNYAFKVKSPEVLLRGLVGTDSRYTVGEIEEQLRNIIVTRFSDVMGESKIPILDAASNYNEFSQFLQTNTQKEFEEYGLELTKFLVENISLPPEVETMLDKRTSMGIVGDMNKFLQFQAATAVEAAANNPGGGGTATAGIGIGVGVGMAQQIMQNMQGGQAAGGAAPPPIPGVSKYFVVQNGQQAGPFEMGAIKTMIQMGQVNQQTLIWKEGMANWTEAGQVGEVSSLFSSTPPPIPGV